MCRGYERGVDQQRGFNLGLNRRLSQGCIRFLLLCVYVLLFLRQTFDFAEINLLRNKNSITSTRPFKTYIEKNSGRILPGLYQTTQINNKNGRWDDGKIILHRRIGNIHCSPKPLLCIITLNVKVKGYHVNLQIYIHPVHKVSRRTF